MLNYEMTASPLACTDVNKNQGGKAKFSNNIKKYLSLLGEHDSRLYFTLHVVHETNYF